MCLSSLLRRGLPSTRFLMHNQAKLYPMTSLLGEIQAFPGAAPAWLCPRHSQLTVPGRTGSSASLTQGTTGHPCDTSVTPTSALFQAGEVSAGSCTWLMMTAGKVASPWSSFALCQCFAGNKVRMVFLWECRIPNSSGGSVKWVGFVFPWHSSSGCVRIAPGTGHTWLSSLGASPFSWMGRKCCCGSELSLLLRLCWLSDTGLEGWRGQSLIALLQFVSCSCYSYRL